MKQHKKRFISDLSFSDGGRKVTIQGEEDRLLGCGITLPLTDENAKDYIAFKSDPNWMDGLVLKTATGGAAHIMPKEEDFIQVPVRCISEAVVGAYSWKACDFSKAGVLRKATAMFKNLPNYTNHDTWDVEGAVGSFHSPYYQSGYTNADGVSVPGGINAIAAVDSIKEPDLCRDIVAGRTYSLSATIKFEWEMSHVFENRYDFFDKCGTMAADGKMIRRIVTKILNIYECSWVFAPADAFARVLDENDQVRRVDVSAIYSFNMPEKPIRGEEVVPKGNIVGLGLEVADAIAGNYVSDLFFGSNEKRGLAKHAERLKVEFRALLGLENDAPDELVHEAVKRGVEALKKAETVAPEIAALQDEIAQLKEAEKNHSAALTKAAEDSEALAVTNFIADLAKSRKVTIQEVQYTLAKPEDIALLTSKAATHDSQVLALRDEIKRAFIASGQNDQGILALVDSADDTQLTALATTAGFKLGTSFKAHCKLCNGTEISFRLSVPIAPTDPNRQTQYKSSVAQQLEAKQLETGSILLRPNNP